eukprot:3842888-Prymnesium_polylepis.3
MATAAFTKTKCIEKRLWPSSRALLVCICMTEKSRRVACDASSSRTVLERPLAPTDLELASEAAMEANKIMALRP